MKIGIVGSGMVGSTGAYAMFMSGVGREIILVDKNTERAESEAFDLNHAVPFKVKHPGRGRVGNKQKHYFISSKKS